MPDATPTILTRVILPPRFWLHEVKPDAGVYEARPWAALGLTVRVVRGDKMRSGDALFNEVGAALQFPPYFGENWDALDECLCDLEWLPARVDYALYVLNAGEVLADEAERWLGVLTRMLQKAVEEWGHEVALGESWDRPAMPFHVVLQAHPKSFESTSARWTATGATVERFG